MKKTISILLIIISLLLIYNGYKIKKVNDNNKLVTIKSIFKDEVLAKEVADYLDVKIDTKIAATLINDVTSISLDNKDVFDLNNLKQLKGLKHLYIYGEATNLDYLKNIKLESFGFSPKNYKELKIIKDINKLDSLEIDLSNIKTFDDFSIFDDIYPLVEISFSDGTVDFKNIENFQAVEKLNLEDVEILNSDKLSEYKLLSYLSISANDKDFSLNQLHDISEVSFLEFSGKVVDLPTEYNGYSISLDDLYEEEFEKIYNYKNLVRLTIINQESFDSAKLDPKLSLDSISLVDMKIKDYSFMENYPFLLYLRLENVGLSSLNELPPLTELHTLEVADNKLKDLKGVKRFKNIYLLDVEGNKIKNYDNLQSLEELSTVIK